MKIDVTRRAAALVAAIALVPQIVLTQQRTAPYTLGTGLPLGSTGVRLGGYLALDWEKPAGDVQMFTFDDLSLFVFGDLGSRARFFVEIEDSKFWQVKNGASRVQHHGDLERLYLDYLHGDALKVRAGKFLTPIGTWNEIHPDPLTWTVSRPLASYATFPTFITGVQVFGTIAGAAHDLDYAVFAQANDCLDCTTGERQTDRLVGGRVRWRWSAVEVGLIMRREPGETLTDRGAARLFLKQKLFWRDGTRIVPVNLPPDHEARELFSRTVLKRSRLRRCPSRAARGSSSSRTRRDRACPA